MKIEIQQQEVAEFSQEWFDFKDGVKLRIADTRKPAFNRALELNNIQAEQELQGMKQVTDDSAVKSSLAFNRSVSHLITGWNGIETKDNPFEYSPKNAELLCTSTKYSNEIVVFAITKASELKRIAMKAVEDEVGKSLSTMSKETSSGRQKSRRHL
ncbi:hypothetical protein ACG94X_06550 [Acinetobacter sp. ULE_I010]|uniref:hypothetical protein n=1 Tax=Acinetobacter sp. ULE_I010 TaxID=3373065 RepID=UPI003AF43B15